MTSTTKTPKTTTILSAQTTSGNLDLADESLVGVEMPAAWTAADITFEQSMDGVTWTPVSDSDKVQCKIALPVASTYYGFTSALLAVFSGIRRVRLVSSVAQVADRILKLQTRQMA